jgi:hypothetical protein
MSFNLHGDHKRNGVCLDDSIPATVTRASF